MAEEVLVREDPATYYIKQSSGRILPVRKADLTEAQHMEMKALAPSAGVAGGDVFPGEIMYEAQPQKAPQKAKPGAKASNLFFKPESNWTPPDAPKGGQPLPMPGEQPGVQPPGAQQFFGGSAQGGGGQSMSGPAGAFGINIPKTQGQRQYESQVKAADLPGQAAAGQKEVQNIFADAVAANKDYDKELARLVAPDFATQAGEAVGVGTAIAYQQRDIQQRANTIKTRMDEMALGLQYPGAPSEQVRQWKSVLDAAGSDDPRSLGPSYYRQYVTAAENLRKAQEMPSAEPKGWNKAVNAIAMALGAFGASLTKTPNFAQQYIDNVINREVARQKDEYERKKTGYNAQTNLYGQAMDEFKDSVNAYQVASGLLQQKLSHALQKAGVVQASQQIALGAQKSLLDASQNIAVLDSQRQLAGVSAGLELSGRAGQAAPGAVKEGLSKEISESVNSVKVWSTLEEEFKKGGGSTLIGSLMKSFPFKATKEAQYEAIRKWALPQVASGRMGRLTDRDLELLSEYVVTAGTSPSAAKYLFRKFRSGALSDLKRTLDRTHMEHSDTGAAYNYVDAQLGPQWRKEAASGYRSESFDAAPDPQAED